MITEASRLAYPEGATLDEDNCELLNDGDRVRRYGLNSNYATTDFTPILLGGVGSKWKIKSHIWRNVANDPLLDILVVSRYGTLYFYKITNDGTLVSYTQIAGTVDLTTFKLSTATNSDVTSSYVNMASGKGVLFVVNKYIEPFQVEFDPDTDTITATQIDILVRDHYGIEDNLAVDQDPVTLSAQHHYNLLNQGWEYSGGGLTSTGGAVGDTSSPTLPVIEITDPGTTPFLPPVVSITPDPFTVVNPSYDPDLPNVIIQPPDVLVDTYTERLGVGTMQSQVQYVFPVFDITLSGPAQAGPIAKYQTVTGYYPSNAKVWWAGKDAEGNFDPALLQKTFFGNTRAPRGHFVISPFKKNRTAVSGIPGLDEEDSETRPDAICFASGRVFFGHESTVYMSPTLETVKRVGQCYQEADPTSEDISDLIPTDGGFIEISDADYILELKPLADGIIVLATNGVWFINSGAKGFTALDYTVNRISDLGIVARESAVLANDALFYWSRQGIHVLAPATGQFGQIPGQFTNQNITESTIKSFYNQIGEFSREHTKGVYDPSTSSVIWLYRNSESSRERGILKYDLRFNAFIPQSTAGTNISIADMFVYNYYTKNTQFETFVTFLCNEKQYVGGGTQAYRDYLVTGQFIDDTFVDGRYTVENTNSPGGESRPTPMTVSTYASYMEGGHEVMEDGLRKKQVPFLGVFFRPSDSCKMIVKWSWANNSNSNKWHGPIQVYRPRNSPSLSGAQNTANEGYYDILYTRNKVRGSGRAIQFRFYEDTENNGFRIVGWHAFYQGNTVP